MKTYLTRITSFHHSCAILCLTVCVLMLSSGLGQAAIRGGDSHAEIDVETISGEWTMKFEPYDAVPLVMVPTSASTGIFAVWDGYLVGRYTLDRLTQVITFRGMNMFWGVPFCFAGIVKGGTHMSGTYFDPFMGNQRLSWEAYR